MHIHYSTEHVNSMHGTAYNLAFRYTELLLIITFRLENETVCEYMAIKPTEVRIQYRVFCCICKEKNQSI